MPKIGRITFSVGAVTNTGTGKSCSIDDAIRAADRLMYSAKRAGKNIVKVEVLAQ